MEEERGGKRAWESLVVLGKKEGYLYPLKNMAVGVQETQTGYSGSNLNRIIRLVVDYRIIRFLEISGCKYPVSISARNRSILLKSDNPISLKYPVSKYPVAQNIRLKNIQFLKISGSSENPVSQNIRFLKISGTSKYPVP